MGGSFRPRSSPCTMMSPPIMRVEVPQEVCHTYSCLPSRLRYLMSKPFAKFCPRLCEVPICSARPSSIMASIV